MARIRTIKPDFWTDDKIVQLSYPARLFFIGMWNFADDHGGIENSPTQLKMRIFPADSVSVAELLQELVAQGLLIEYAVNGKNYYQIKSFREHQKINRPSSPNIPAYPHGALHEGREGKGREEEGKNIYGEFVRLTESEHGKLVEKFGKADTSKRIESLNHYVGSKGKQYKSHYHTILNWASRDSSPDAVGPKRECLCGKKARVQVGNQWFCHKCFDEKGI